MLKRLAWLGLLLPLLLIACVAIFHPDFILDGYQSRPFTFEQRVLTQLRLLWTYIAWIVLPMNDAYGLFHDDIKLSQSWFQPATTWLSGLAWLVVIAVAFMMRQRLPLLFFAVLFYLIAHSIESSIFALEPVFEHRNYLAALAVSVLLAAACIRLTRCWSKRHLRLVFILVLMPFVLQLALRAYIWADEDRLALSSYLNHPESTRSHFMYANNLVRRANGESGLQADVAKAEALLIAARNEYELIVQKEPMHLPSLVMLYRLDSKNFSFLNSRELWLERILQTLAEKRLQTTDYGALSSFVACAGDLQCAVPAGAMERAFDLARQKNGDSVRIALLEYEYMRALNASAQDRITFLNQLAARFPNSQALHRKLLEEYAAAGEQGQMYLALAQIMALDSLRRYSVLRFEHDTSD